MAFPWVFGDGKYSQISRSLLSIKIDFGPDFSSDLQFLQSLFQAFGKCSNCHPPAHSTKDVWPFHVGGQILAEPAVCTYCKFLDPDSWIHCLRRKPK